MPPIEVDCQLVLTLFEKSIARRPKQHRKLDEKAALAPECELGVIRASRDLAPIGVKRHVEQRAEGRCGLVVGRRDEVRVHVQGRARVAVPESARHSADVDARREQPRGDVVAQVVLMPTSA